MEFVVFGGLRVFRHGEALDLGPPKQRAVLATLLLEADRVVAVDRLIDLLWDDGADGATASLQAYVSRLRVALEPDRRAREPASVLLTQPPGYRLVVPRDQVDLFRFTTAVESGSAEISNGDLVSGLATLESALVLTAGGPVLPELGDLPNVVDASRRVESLRLTAVEAIGEARLGLGDHAAAVAALEPAAVDHPGREHLTGLLALALYRMQRQADALDAIDRCRRALRDSSGLHPGIDLQRLEADILDQAPALDHVPVAEAAVAVPDRPQTHGPSSGLIGRDRELGAASGALDALVSGRGGVVVISGEPGIGKSTLAEALVESARALGLASAWARCPEHRATPPLWVLAQLAEQLAPSGIVLPAGGARPNAARTGSNPTERFALFAQVTAALAASSRPVVLVVDDLQWTDPDSLRLVEHIATELGSLPVLVVITTRPLGDDAPPATVDTLSELARVPGSLQLRPNDLSVAEVEQWLTSLSEDVADGVAGLVHERTGGNPLFVKEVVALLVADGGLRDETKARVARAIPPAIQFVVRRRVSALAQPTQQLLSVAAVIGPRFDLSVLAAISDRDPVVVLSELEPAFTAGLVFDTGGEVSFSHVVVAEALAEEVNPSRRAMIHAAAARSIADAAGPGFGNHAASVAHHAIEGMLAGSGELAVEASRRAATAATAQAAHEDAASHWAAAAQALAQWRPADVPSRVEALIEQARALDRVDMVRAAKVPILAAVLAADAGRHVDLMVEAASLLNHSDVWSVEPYGEVDEQIVTALERTLTLVEADDVHRRAVLLGALPAELVFADRHRHVTACDRAIDAARRTGEPLTLALALNNTVLPKRPDQLDIRRHRAIEMLELADAGDLPVELVYAAQHHMAEVFLEAGDLGAAAHHLELGRLVLTSTPGSRLHNQYFWFAATLATATGRYDDASRLISEAYDLHRRRRRYDSDVLLLSANVAIAIDRGGFDGVLDFALRSVDVGGYQRSTAEALAFGALEAGSVDGARTLVAPYGVDVGFGDDFMTLFCATAALHVRVELGDLEGAAAAVEAVAGYPDRWAGAGAASLSLGFVSLALARFHAATEDEARARRYFDDAIGSAERAGTPAWLARSLTHQAAFLRDAGDRAAAEEAVGTAAALARRHRLPYVDRRLELLAP